MEILLINRDNSPLNKNKNQESLPLEPSGSQGKRFHHTISRNIDPFRCVSFILRVLLLSHEFYI